MQLFKATASGNHPGPRGNAKTTKSLDDRLLLFGGDLGSDENFRRKRIGVSHHLLSTQIRAVLSSLAVANRRPSGLNTTFHTRWLWVTVASSLPVLAFQIRAVMSSLASRRPSGLNTAPHSPMPLS
ncbi:MAG: hypothetical protein ACT4NP_10755 [Pseudonocardiales bacterium]